MEEFKECPPKGRHSTKEIDKKAKGSGRWYFIKTTDKNAAYIFFNITNHFYNVCYSFSESVFRDLGVLSIFNWFGSSVSWTISWDNGDGSTDFRE